jgi:hypothetical protein
MNYYDALGVPREAAPEQIRAAYRALVQLFHPDRLRHLRPEVRAFAEERLKALNQAYDVLSDPVKRAAYDRTAAAPPPPSPPPPPRQRPAPPPPPAPRYNPAPVSAQWSPAQPAVPARERQQQRERLEQQILEVDRSLRALLYERDQAHTQLRGERERSVFRFWLVTGATTLTAGAVVLYGLWAVPHLPLMDWALTLVFGLLVVWHEFVTVLALAVACRPPGQRLILTGVTWLTLRAGLVALPLGLAGWAVWRLLLLDPRAPLTLAITGVTTVVTHVVFCWLAQGGQTRVALEKRRLFDQANELVRRAYEHELSSLKARRAALELE